jgi:hypothetical protein
MILILTINMLFLTATEQYFAYLILEKILSNLAIQRGLLHNKDILLIVFHMNRKIKKKGIAYITFRYFTYHIAVISHKN